MTSLKCSMASISLSFLVVFFSSGDVGVFFLRPSLFRMAKQRGAYDPRNFSRHQCPPFFARFPFEPDLVRFRSGNRPVVDPDRSRIERERTRPRHLVPDETPRHTCAMEASTSAIRVACRRTRAPCGGWRRKQRKCVMARAETDGGGDVPWHVGTYFSKRKHHRHDRWGRIDQDEDDANVVQPLFDDAAKEALAVRVVAKECGLEESVVASRLARLRSLLPDVGEKWRAMKAADLARLAVDVEEVAKAMVRLKTALPNANVSIMVAKQPGLLFWDAARLEGAIQGAQALLPNVRDFDGLAEKNPLVLQVEKLEEGLKELRRLMPKQDVENLLERDPNLLLNVQSGSDMIPYDNGSLQQLQQTLRGGPDAAPSGW